MSDNTRRRCDEKYTLKCRKYCPSGTLDQVRDRLEKAQDVGKAPIHVLEGFPLMQEPRAKTGGSVAMGADESDSSSLCVG